MVLTVAHTLSCQLMDATMTSANMDSIVNHAKPPFDMNLNTTAILFTPSLYPCFNTVSPLDKLTFIKSGKNVLQYLGLTVWRLEDITPFFVTRSIIHP